MHHNCCYIVVHAGGRRSFQPSQRDYTISYQACVCITSSISYPPHSSLSLSLTDTNTHTNTSLFQCHRQKLKEETICNSKPFLRGRNPRRKKHPNPCEIIGVLKNFKHWVVVIVVDPVMCGVQFQGAHRERLYWGTYRPNLYLGIRARFVNKTATTAI